jgi:outer membrane protein assembly factor BamE (lipoprotein component of BamABCDE complex)
MGKVGVAARALAAIAFVALLLPGCLSLGNSKLRDDAAVAQIKVGETRKDEVHAVLGAPTERRSIALGSHTYEWWAYSYSSSVINPLDYFLLVGLFVNGIGLPDTRRDFQVFFDPDGTVRSVMDQTTSYDLGVIRENHVASDVKTETVLTPLRRESAIRYEERIGGNSR